MHVLGLRLGLINFYCTLSKEGFSGQESCALRYEKVQETLKMLQYPLWPHPGPKIWVITTQAALRDLRFSDVSDVNRVFTAKGTISPILVAAKSCSRDQC